VNPEIIPFNRPHMTGEEFSRISNARLNGILSGDGPFTKQCHNWLEKKTGSNKALLTHSCTAALEMSALLLEIQPGDEIIMPSYTFVSTANAFVLRGGVPVFVDIRPDTLNIDEHLIEAAITPKTRAIAPVHYAGVGCKMDHIMEIARHHNLAVVEDAAQGVMSTYKGQALGSIGDLGCYSFHETKNVISGEGGALLINNSQLSERAEVIREKGTNRSRFFRGQVDKYTWQDLGSSFLPGELTAAFLSAQLDDAEKITVERLKIWNNYHTLLENLESDEMLTRPYIPADCQHNGHMYYIILNKSIERDKVIQQLKLDEINTVFHYIPLHSSPAGLKFGRFTGNLKNTNELSNQLIRLPMWIGLTEEMQLRIVESLKSALKIASK
jgi:dTDP-4-amino-4,6-dideoxygalactose transaminase